MLANLKIQSVLPFLLFTGISIIICWIIMHEIEKEQKTSQRSACINNLRQIEAAKTSYGLDKGLTNRANCTLNGAVDDVEVFSNLVGGATGYIKTWPLCPASTTEVAKVSAMAALCAYDYRPNCLGSNSCCNHQGNSGAFSHILPGARGRNRLK